MIFGIVQAAYVLATGLFILALHWMNDPKTARKGVMAGVAGMSLAVIATWAQPGVGHHLWIMLAIAAGVAVGVPLARVPLTAVPQRTALDIFLKVYCILLFEIVKQRQVSSSIAKGFKIAVVPLHFNRQNRQDNGKTMQSQAKTIVNFNFFLLFLKLNHVFRKPRP